MRRRLLVDEGLLIISLAFARPLAVGENIHNLPTTRYILINFAFMLHSLTTGMQNTFFDGRGFAEHQSILLLSVSKNPHNL